MGSVLIWLSCVPILWLSSSGPVAGYHVDVGGTAHDVVDASGVACVTEKYTPTYVAVQAFSALGDTSVWSDSLMLERVHDFDSDDNGSVGFADFGAFSGAYGTQDERFDVDGNGWVGFPDFGRFVASYGCQYLESGLVEVPQ